MPDKTTIDILRDAKTLLETKGWTQHHYARNAEGAGASLAADAVCFCALGAISVASGGNPDDDYGSAAAYALARTCGGGSTWTVPEFNDAEGRTVAEVLAKFDEAIAAEEAKLVSEVPA